MGFWKHCIILCIVCPIQFMDEIPGIHYNHVGSHRKGRQKRHKKVEIPSLHAPGSAQTAADESQACAFGIPECMPPNRRRDFKVRGIQKIRFSKPSGQTLGGHKQKNAPGRIGINLFLVTNNVSRKRGRIG